MDRIQELVEQWRAERPDLDLAAMATVARLLAAAGRIGAVIDALAAEHGLSRAEGDIVFTLRRAGAPYRLTPSRLSSALLVSSGTLTSRLDRLESRGLIERVPHASDRRSLEVQLTRRGRELADAAVTEHVANEQRFLEPLSARERDQLDRILSKLL